jgi:hypothetical protein
MNVRFAMFLRHFSILLVTISRVYDEIVICAGTIFMWNRLHVQ